MSEHNHRDILLVAVNARYSHCSFAARSLLANLGTLERQAAILECDLEITPVQLAERITAHNPRIVSFSVYLWNVRLIESTARILRLVAPDLKLVAGGSEITSEYPHVNLFDAVIIGEGEAAFRAFCETSIPSPAPSLSTSPSQRDPNSQLLTPNSQFLIPNSLTLPYHLYTDEDLSRRTIYVETSRGCPYNCGYCASAGSGLRLLPLDRILPAFDRLWQRGLRRFKFLDRNFNAPVAHACAVLDFFQERVTPKDTCLHLEINPERLHPDVADRLARFPAGTLHLEAGIQTLNPQVAAAAGRSPDTATTLANLRFLTRETGADVHADLIFGLPGEDEASFANGFNTLVTTCAPPEVQVNLLKGLPGTRFAREADSLGLVFSPEPPYELLRSDTMGFETLCRIQRLARCWERVHNRGRFPHAVRAFHAACGPDLFGAYTRLAARLYAGEGRLFAIGMPRLAGYLREELTETCGLGAAEADRLLTADLNAKTLHEG
ncbi:MAG TPA: DUF4080 domain-containing protein [Kiritimatiellia bacterium]|nr:DUF4080 domain-containing protein [Kiritimatiellia bacterium]